MLIHARAGQLFAASQQSEASNSLDIYAKQCLFEASHLSANPSLQAETQTKALSKSKPSLPWS